MDQPPSSPRRRRPITIWIALTAIGAALFVVGLMPGMPKSPTFAIAAVVALVGVVGLLVTIILAGGRPRS